MLVADRITLFDSSSRAEKIVCHIRLLPFAVSFVTKEFCEGNHEDLVAKIIEKKKH